MKTVRLFSYWLCLGLCFVALTGCGSKEASLKISKTPKPQYGASPDKPIADVLKFPQDLTFYASKVTSGPLMSAGVQNAETAKFKRIFYGVWSQKKAGFSKRTFTSLFGRARGYNGSQPWSSSAWAALKHNANIPSYPNVQRPAMTLRQTSLREMPTMKPRFSKPTPNPGQSPFDYFQYAALPPGLPVFVSQVSRDKRWYFIENSIAGGWVQAKDVAFVDDSTIQKYRSLPLTAIIRDRVSLSSSGGYAYIGAAFPQVRKGSGSFSVLVPNGSKGGIAQVAKVNISSADAVTMPMPITAANLAMVGNVMMGQTYGWGGVNDNRDCSSSLRDMFTPFGISMPRNSLGQYRSGQEISLRGQSDSAKLRSIASMSKPFITLVWMPGHIGLYLGNEQGQPMMFHNVWGVRVEESAGEDDRHVIGKAVVTTLEPGKELPNIYNNQTIIRRIGGISILP